MPKVNVYLPEDLAVAVRDAQVPISAICKSALERAVRDVSALRGSHEASAQPASGLFLTFTPRARKAIELGRLSAVEHKQSHVGTEHLLLGIIDEGGNLALRVLTALDVDPGDIRSELEASLGRGSVRAGTSPPFKPEAKKALEVTVKEARGLGHNFVGCEHVLLGVLATENGLASQVLRRLGVELRTTRRAVVTALAGYMQSRGQQVAPRPSVASALDEILARLDVIERRLAS